ncbi:MAG: DUF4911 domain-containing protein [Myxococcales bacterium]
MSAASPEFSPRGEGLVERRARVKPENVAWLRYVLEAHDGLAFMHVSQDSHGSDEVFLLAPAGLTSQLDELIRDLLDEGCLEALCDPPPGPSP